MVLAHVKRVLFSLSHLLPRAQWRSLGDLFFIFYSTQGHSFRPLSLRVACGGTESSKIPPSSAPAGRHKPISNYYDDARRISALWSRPNELCVYGASGPVFSHLPDGLQHPSRQVRCWRKDEMMMINNNTHFLLNRLNADWKGPSLELVVNHSAQMIILFIGLDLFIWEQLCWYIVSSSCQNSLLEKHEISKKSLYWFIFNFFFSRYID